MEATRQVAASDRNEAPAGSDSPSGSGPRATTEIRVARSVVAAVPRWLAYVWPAIALGRTGKILAAVLAGGEGATSFPIPAVAQSLFRPRGITGTNDASAISGQSATPKSPLGAPSVDPVPGGGMNLFLTMVTLLLALIALIALARLVIGEEFFSSLRSSR